MDYFPFLGSPKSEYTMFPTLKCGHYGMRVLKGAELVAIFYKSVDSDYAIFPNPLVVIEVLAVIKNVK